MIEKIVDDWLTNVGEKEFEVPFSQMLALRGYKVIHVANPHGPQEQGKDMIATDEKGRVVAFQLKSGDITHRNWVNPKQPLKGQVEDLLDSQARHPSIQNPAVHRGILVTTGKLDETMRETIDSFNGMRKARRKPLLTVWTKAELSEMILESLSNFVPLGRDYTREFMRLYLEDGTSLPDKKRLAKFFEAVAASLSGKRSKEKVQKCCAEIVLLASHLVHPYYSKANHIGVAEVWGVVASTILWVISKSKVSLRWAGSSLQFLEQGIWSALCGLMKELQKRTDLREGHQLTDWMATEVRATYVMAYSGLAVIWSRHLGHDLGFGDQFDALCKKYAKQIRLWGEGAVPFFLAFTWAQELLGKVRSTESYAALICNAITRENVRPRGAARSGAGRGFLSPYATIDEAMLAIIDGEREEARSLACSGDSYMLEGLLHILVRRNLRQTLNALWERVTRIAFERYIPETPADLWRADNDPAGFLETFNTPHPTRWSDLLRQVDSPDPRLTPPLAEQVPHLLLLHLLLYPYRFNPATAVILDRQTWVPAGSE